MKMNTARIAGAVYFANPTPYSSYGGIGSALRGPRQFWLGLWMIRGT